jgi:hypothetical protein
MTGKEKITYGKGEKIKIEDIYKKESRKRKRDSFRERIMK